MQRLFTGNVWEVDNRGTQSLAAKGVGMMASRRRLGRVRACRPPGSARKQAVAGRQPCDLVELHAAPVGTAVQLYS
jgi:hypothetical protein